MASFFGFLVRYVRPYAPVLLLGMLLSAVYGAGGAAVPAVAELALEHFFVEGQSQEMRTLLAVGGLFVLVWVLRGFAGFGGGYLMTYCGVRVAIDLRCALFDKLQSFELAYFGRQRSGDLIAKLNNDTREVEKAMLDIAADSVRMPAQMLFAIGYLVYVSVQQEQLKYLLMFLCATPLLIMPTRLIGARLRRRGRQYQDAIGEVTNHLQENLAALEEVRAFQLEAPQSAGFRAKVESSLTTFLRVKKYILTQQPSMEAIASVVLAAAFVIAARTGIPAKTFFALFLAIYFAVDPLRRVVRTINTMHRVEGAMHRLQAILDHEPGILDPAAPAEVGALRGDVLFEGVRFAYDPAEGEVLRGIDVAIPAGQVVALVGPSGAGKSTFTKLIPRLYEPTEGRVTIDGVDVRDMRAADLRRQVGAVRRAAVGQPGLRPARRRPRGDRGRGAGGARPRVHRGLRPGLRHAGRRVGQPAVGRPEAAGGDRAGLPQERAAADPRRGDVGPRRRQRGGDPGRAARAGAGQDGADHRPPLQLDPPRRPHPGLRRGPDRRGRDPRPAARRRGAVPRPVPAAVQRVRRDGLRAIYAPQSRGCRLPAVCVIEVLRFVTYFTTRTPLVSASTVPALSALRPPFERVFELAYLRPAWRTGSRA